ncbi:thiopurine S-methyltransferase [Pseudomonas syringae pv. syringae]|uniref:thiopurine S-methyltransferase n=1 Tax=Pseudomonas syringae TaxID=317 RepID=UPI0007AED4D8|nr:thiopurine S-methyltransferase [Pseudomonas syringae]KZL37774.1 thiopurine S-methyltransferase [Pseudomonas syringae pv. syringae]MBI6709195.1 thiopurine S-methyltransferase [Pseudomonas syringae]
MQADFWLQRWSAGQIGFHQSEVNQDLQQYWSSLRVAQGARVLVPLCGKSQDMSWLRGQGYHVVGAELSEAAVKSYFTERGEQPHVTSQGDFEVYAVPGIEIWCGDFFALTVRDIGHCAAFYDRAAMIALPADMRERYVQHLEALMPQTCSGLLITLEYDQTLLEGPPFSVPCTWLQRVMSGSWEVTKVGGQDTLHSSAKGLKAGLERMDEHVYVLERQSR